MFKVALNIITLTINRDSLYVAADRINKKYPPRPLQASCLSFCTCSFGPLCCLFFFDLRILIAPLGIFKFFLHDDRHGEIMHLYNRVYLLLPKPLSTSRYTDHFFPFSNGDWINDCNPWLLSIITWNESKLYANCLHLYRKTIEFVIE